MTAILEQPGIASDTVHPTATPIMITEVYPGYWQGLLGTAAVVEGVAHDVPGTWNRVVRPDGSTVPVRGMKLYDPEEVRIGSRVVAFEIAGSTFGKLGVLVGEGGLVQLDQGQEINENELEDSQRLLGFARKLVVLAQPRDRAVGGVPVDPGRYRLLPGASSLGYYPMTTPTVHQHWGAIGTVTANSTDQEGEVVIQVNDTTSFYVNFADLEKVDEEASPIERPMVRGRQPFTPGNYRALSGARSHGVSEPNASLRDLVGLVGEVSASTTDHDGDILVDFGEGRIRYVNAGDLEPAEHLAEQLTSELLASEQPADEQFLREELRRVSEQLNTERRQREALSRKFDEMGEAAAELAKEHGWCSVYDDFARDWGLPECEREYNVTMTVSVTVTRQVTARGEEDAENQAGDLSNDDLAEELRYGSADIISVDDSEVQAD